MHRWIAWLQRVGSTLALLYEQQYKSRSPLLLLSLGDISECTALGILELSDRHVDATSPLHQGMAFNWLRPVLAPRDRSLITVSALIVNNQNAQINYHLGRAMDNGLTQEQASEVLIHIAFYAGCRTRSRLFR